MSRPKIKPRKRIDLTSQRFGRLLVLDYVFHDKHGGAWWKCRCDCGTVKAISSSHLRSGSSKSCGCYHKEKLRLKKGEAVFNRVYNDYYQSAKRRNIIFLLSKIELMEITQKDCFYCGSPPHRIKKVRWSNDEFVFNGVDRINSEKGYEQENCVPCCYLCNKMKSNMSVSEFLDQINKINTHAPKKPIK